MRRFLQLALDLVDDLVFHLLDRGARPDRLHDHDAEGEIGIFLLAHAHQAEHAGDDDQAEQEARDARMADRPARKIEGLLFIGWWWSSASFRSRSIRVQRDGRGRVAGQRPTAAAAPSASPSGLRVMNCVPAATTTSPGFSPSATLHAVAGEIGDLDRAGMHGLAGAVDGPDDLLTILFRQRAERDRNQLPASWPTEASILAVMPSSTRGSFGRLTRTAKVRDCWSALPATSRTLPASVSASSDQKLALTSLPGLNAAMSISGTAISTSFSPSTATVTPACPSRPPGRHRH